MARKLNRDAVQELLPDVPFRIELEVINVCNKRCDYCYAAPFDGYIPPLGQLRYIIDKTEWQVHPFEVIFLGSEPFLRTDMVDLLEYGTSTFAVGKVSISSNGTVFKGMSRDKINRLKHLADTGSIIQVSIDSATNPNMQKGPDSLEGINVLDTNGIDFRAGIVLTRQNYGDYLNTISVLLEFPRLTGINLEPLQKINDAHFDSNMLSTDQMLRMKDAVLGLVNRKGRGDVYIVGITENATGDLKNQLMQRRNTGFELHDPKIVNAGIYANGDVSMNGALGRANMVGNLLRQDWKDIWSEARRIYRNERMGLVILDSKRRCPCTT